MIYDLGSLDPPHSPPLPPPESTVAKGQAMEDGKICVGLAVPSTNATATASVTSSRSAENLTTSLLPSPLLRSPSTVGSLWT